MNCYAKAKTPTPRVGLLAFDDSDAIVAGDCRRDLAAVVAGRVRVADALAGRVGDVDRDGVAAATELFGPDGLTASYPN